MSAATNRQADMLARSQEIALRSQVLSHQPAFVRFTRGPSASPRKPVYSFIVHNSGKTCHDILMRSEHGGTNSEVCIGRWQANEAQTFAVTLAEPGPGQTTMSFTYLDELLVRQKQTFIVDVGEAAAPRDVYAVLADLTFNLPAPSAPGGT